MSKEFVEPKPKAKESAEDYRIRRELACLNFVMKTLLTLQPDERRRTMAYLIDRYIDHPESEASR